MSAALLAQEDGTGKVVAFEEFLCRAFEADLPLFEEDGPVGNCEGDIQGLLDDARNIEERVREAFERAQAMALPAPGDDDDEDDVPMVR